MDELLVVFLLSPLPPSLYFFLTDNPHTAQDEEDDTAKYYQDNIIDGFPDIHYLPNLR